MIDLSGLHPMWKCGKCGVEFGDPTQHAQAPSQCPNCLAGIQNLVERVESVGTEAPIESAEMESPLMLESPAEASEAAVEASEKLEETGDAGKTGEL